jgi:CheY-like chemotaxis protein
MQTMEMRDEIGKFSGESEGLLTDAETILFVEDEKFVRDVTCEVLRSAGYRVVTAKNASEGLGLYEAHHGQVDLLLTDVVLPGQTGRALAARLRRQDPELRVLFVTGYAEQMGLREIRLTECLAKPFSTEALLERVRHLVGGVGVPVEAEDMLTPVCDNA